MQKEVFNSTTNPEGIAFSIVVYREIYYQTPVFQSLISAINSCDTALTTTIFVYDNTDAENWIVTQWANHRNISIWYRHDPLNPGISKAYNHICKAAQQYGYKWIVFLDQDTTLPPSAVFEYMQAIRNHPEVFIKAPVLLVNKVIFSPSKAVLKRSVRLKHIHPGVAGLKPYLVVNSGMLVQLHFFFSVGGYNENVRLDFTDFLFLERAKQKTQQFEVLPFNCQHEFSHNEVSIKKALNRYVIFLKDLTNCPKNTLADWLGYAFVDWLHLIKLTVRHRSFAFFRKKFFESRQYQPTANG